MEPTEGAKPSPEEEIETLRDMLIEFLDPDSLREVAGSLRQNQRVDWKTVANWELLPQIRSLLDRLPDSRGKSTPTRSGEFTRFVATLPDELQVLDGIPFKVEPKICGVLAYLLDQPDRRARIEDVMLHVWGDADEGHSALSSVLKRIRRVLEERRIALTVRQTTGYVILERTKKLSGPTSKSRRRTRKRNAKGKSRTKTRRP